MKRLLALGLVLVVVASGAGWYYFEGPCGVSAVKRGADELQGLIIEWKDAIQLANQTPRISLPGQISNLQDIRHKVDKMKLPACLDPARADLQVSMNYGIDAFIAFVGQKTDFTVSQAFENSATSMAAFSEKLADVKTCAPFCGAP